MEAEEFEAFAECADCGAQVPEGAEPSFAFGEGVLCFECAVRRGGVYDADEDHWTVAPDLSGLAVDAEQ